MNDVLRTIIDGLTYGGQFLHILINYILIILTVAPFMLPRDLRADGKRHGWKICLMVITFLQVVVWFVVGAVGVSLVWCAMAGFLAFDYWRGGVGQAKNKKRLAQVALTAALAAIMYYAIAFPIITTVAHIVAVLVGMSLFLILQQRDNRLTSSS